MARELVVRRQALFLDGLYMAGKLIVFSAGFPDSRKVFLFDGAIQLFRSL
jgi:hypothetical protein